MVQCYQLLKDSWHLIWHKAALRNIKSTFTAYHCCVPCGCSISVWHKGSKGRFTVVVYSDWKHRLNLAFRYKTLIEITESSQQNQEKSDLTSLKFLRGKTKSFKTTRRTELDLKHSYQFIARGFHRSSWEQRAYKNNWGWEGEEGTDILRGSLKSEGIFLIRSKRASVVQIWKHKTGHTIAALLPLP